MKSIKESNYEKKMTDIVMKLVKATAGTNDKKSSEINSMAKSIKSDISSGAGISPKQAKWIADTWKSFNENVEINGDNINEDDETTNVNSIANVIKFAQEGNPSKLKSEIGNVLGAKIMDHIDTRRKEIAQDMFGK